MYCNGKKRMIKSGVSYRLKVFALILPLMVMAAFLQEKKLIQLDLKINPNSTCSHGIVTNKVFSLSFIEGR